MLLFPAKPEEVMAKSPAAKTAQAKPKTNASETIQKKLVLTGADIVKLGPEAELLVGGKNYNTALISQIEGIQASAFSRYFVRGLPSRAG